MAKINDKRKYNSGRPPKYTPEEFYKKCQEYVGLTKDKTYDTNVILRGEAGTMSKRYPVNIYDFCFFAEIHKDTYFEYRKKKEYADSFTLIDMYIKSSQYKGAMTGEFNSNFVARINDVADNVNNNVVQEQVIKVKFGE